MATKLIIPNVSFGEQCYLVRLNDKVVGMMDTEDEAVKAIASIASSEEKKLKDGGLSVFRKYLNHNKEIQLHVQNPWRIFSGTLSPKVTVKITNVTQLNYVSPYADKIARFKAEKAKSEVFAESYDVGSK